MKTPQPPFNQVLDTMYELERKSRHRDASIEGMSAVIAYVQNDDMRSLSQMLLTADFDKLNGWSIVGLVRTASRVAYKMNSWSDIYEKASARLTELGIDAKKLLTPVQQESVTGIGTEAPRHTSPTHGA